MDNKKIGKTIASLRKGLGLTQNQLAEKIFVSDKAISRWETGEGLPEISNLIELAKVFNVTVDYIINEQTENNVKKTNDNIATEIDQPKEKQVSTMSDEKLNELLRLADKNVSTSSQAVNSNNAKNNQPKANIKEPTSFSIYGIISLITVGLGLILTFFAGALFGVVLGVVALILATVGGKKDNVSASDKTLIKIAKITSIILIVISLILLVISIIIIVSFGGIFGDMFGMFKNAFDMAENSMDNFGNGDFNFNIALFK